MDVSVALSPLFHSVLLLEPATDRPSSDLAASNETPGFSRAAAWNECEPRAPSCLVKAIGTQTASSLLMNMNDGGITPMIS